MQCSCRGQALDYARPGVTRKMSDLNPPTAPRGDGEDDPMAWTHKLISDLPDLRSPITVNVDTLCSEAVTKMKNYGVDQLPVVQQFPGMGPDAQQVIAVISMAALSREMLKHPEIVDSPLFPYASPKFVVVEPSATLGDVADALSAFTDRRSGDTGSAIVAEKVQGKWLLKHVISRVDILAFETDSLHASQAKKK
jgi:CBS domain-containing protein